jgi:hypothetical protein
MPILNSMAHARLTDASKLAMPLDTPRAKQILNESLKEISLRSGEARTSAFPSLRSVDAKVREVKITLRDAGASELVDEMGRDSDFIANSRRVRLEALANYCRTAIKFLDTGVITQKRQLVRGPDLTQITDIMPDLEAIIQARWLDAQRCQLARAHLAAVVMMGSILEALLLARCSKTPTDSYRAHASPKDKTGKVIAIPHWNLST